LYDCPQQICNNEATTIFIDSDEEEKENEGLLRSAIIDSGCGLFLTDNQ
jgi:hypothetical protein